MGDGEYSGHRIPELPADFLTQLAKRYPLEASKCDLSDAFTLLITVAVHEEVARRASGGHAERHLPTVNEFATHIVNHGFRALSKIHHPDLKGDTDTQRRLNEARDLLLPMAENIDGDQHSEDIKIPSGGPEAHSPPTSRWPPPDGDLPF